MNTQETEKKIYNVFLIDKKNFIPTFTLNPTSGKHIHEVSKVMAYCEDLDVNARKTYAKEAGLKFDLTENEKLSLPNVYDHYTVDAALAQVLFAGCPSIIEYKDETVKIIDKQLFECLDGGVVRQAFFRFSDAARLDTKRASELIEHLTLVPKAPKAKKPDNHFENYKYALGEWKQAFLEEFNTMNQIIRMLAPGDLVRQKFLFEECTHTEVVEAYCEKIMFG